MRNEKIRNRFKEKVIELADIGISKLCEHFKDGVLEACDEMCDRKRSSRSEGDTCWCDEEAMEVIL